MAITATNSIYVHGIRLMARAFWSRRAGQVRKDVPSTVNGNTKKTLLVGSKRHNKVETFPALTMEVELRQEAIDGGVVTNVEIEALEGAEVFFRLSNQYEKQPKPPLVEFPAHLHNLCASVELTQEQVREIFSPNGPLNARINENLLDFEVWIGPLGLTFESENRVYVYRQKVIVFVPGLLGSTIYIQTSTGKVSIYPSIYPDVSDSQAVEVMRVFAEMVSFQDSKLVWAGQHISEILDRSKIDLLECDAHGKPLLSVNFELFRLLGALPGVQLNNLLKKAVIYDVADQLANVWCAGGDKYNRPEFQPITLLPAPYDWRLDLAKSGDELYSKLQDMQRGLRGSEDTDDLIALAGHSTGGVINRYVCCKPGIDSLVDHAFFMNVPFRGAPKAISVLLFGGSPGPPVGAFEPMVPSALIDTSSMLHIAVNLPIVYFLAPSNAYPDPVCSVSEELRSRFFGRGWSPKTIEEQKEMLLRTAERVGVYQPVRSIDPNIGKEDRAKVAVGAREWHDVWWDCNRREAFGDMWDRRQLARDTHGRLHATENLVFQDGKRLKETLSWNRHIADNAAKFHAESESRIGSSPVQLFVFWSENNVTAGSIEVRLDGNPEPISVRNMGIHWKDYYKGEYPTYDVFDRGFDFRFEWWSGGFRHHVKFNLGLVDGDGTVPRASLLGIGTDKAKILKPIPSDPDHVSAPNHPYVWERVLEVLLGRDVSKYVVTKAEPQNIPWVIAEAARK